MTIIGAVAGSCGACRAEIPVGVGSGDFPGSVRLQAAREMIVLGVDRRALRAHLIPDFFAMLAVDNEFSEELDRS
jgi:hypothetical protein